MTKNDRHIIVDWIGMISPKGIMESTEIEADRKEIQAFLDKIHDLLLGVYVDEPNETCKLVGCLRCHATGVVHIPHSCTRGEPHQQADQSDHASQS